jgi:hypothetical protein
MSPVSLQPVAWNSRQLVMGVSLLCFAAGELNGEWLVQ